MNAYYSTLEGAALKKISAEGKKKMKNWNPMKLTQLHLKPKLPYSV